MNAAIVAIAGLDPEQASGILFKLEIGSALCPHLANSTVGQLKKKVEDGMALLEQSAVGIGPPKQLFYSAKLFQVSSISTMGEAFCADVRVTMSYILTRQDVYQFIMKPVGWQPAWLPNPFLMTNAADMEGGKTRMEPPIVRKVQTQDGSIEIRVFVTWIMSAECHETLELQACDATLPVCLPNQRILPHMPSHMLSHPNECLLLPGQNFPFDVQWFHVKMRSVQDHGVEMLRSDEARDPSACDVGPATQPSM